MAVVEDQRTSLALAALAEVTDPAEVGALLAVEQPEPGVVNLRFACALPAYPGWSWTVSIADLPGEEPTVLEVELLPGEGSLLAPPWVPWTERLAEWRRQHPDEPHPDEEPADSADDELDEDDLAVDDELDELDEAELDGVETDVLDGSDVLESSGDPERDSSDDDLGGDELDDDGFAPRPADEDRGP